MDAGTSSNRCTSSKITVIFRYQRRLEATEEAVIFQAAQIGGGRETMLRSRDDRSFCVAPVWIRGTLLPVRADGLQHSRVLEGYRTHA